MEQATFLGKMNDDVVTVELHLPVQAPARLGFEPGQHARVSVDPERCAFVDSN